MAVSDYSQTAEAVMTPLALLAAPLAVSGAVGTITLTGYQAVVSREEDVQVGSAILIDNEILRVDSVANWPTLDVSRGCADTIPMAHDAGAEVWFLTNNTGNDGVEYTSGDTIGVKLSPFTFSGGEVPLEYVPSHELTFDWRFARPYPPAMLMANDEPWYDGVKFLNVDTGGLTLAWANRNRIQQGDQLLGHHEGSITIEPGVTYTARVYDDTDVLVATYDGLTGTSWLYALGTAEVDLPSGEGHVMFCATRDDLDSLYSYRIDVKIGAAGGLGESLGENLGG